MSSSSDDDSSPVMPPLPAPPPPPPLRFKKGDVVYISLHPDWFKGVVVKTNTNALAFEPVYVVQIISGYSLLLDEDISELEFNVPLDINHFIRKSPPTSRLLWGGTCGARCYPGDTRHSGSIVNV